MNGNFIREVIYYEDYYNLDFLKSQKEDLKKKFNWTLMLISTQERIPENFSNISQELKEYLKFVWKLVPIFLEFSVSLIKEIWSC